MIQFVCDVCGVVNVREETHDLNHPYGYLWQPVIGPRVKLLVYPEFGERDGEHVCSACLLAGLEELIKAMVNPVPHVDLEAIQDMVDSLPSTEAEVRAAIMQDRSANRNEATPYVIPHGGEYEAPDSPALAPGPSSPDPDVQPVPPAPEGQGPGADLPALILRLPEGAGLRPLPHDSHLYTFYALHPDGIVYGHEHDRPCPVEACTYYLTEPEVQVHTHHYCRPTPQSEDGG